MGFIASDGERILKFSSHGKKDSGVRDGQEENPPEGTSGGKQEVSQSTPVAKGDVWQQRSAVWQQRIAELVKFKSKYGHCDVPSKWQFGGLSGGEEVVSYELSIWVHNQRLLHHKGQMPVDRVAELLTIGFNFRLRRRQVSSTHMSSTLLSFPPGHPLEQSHSCLCCDGLSRDISGLAGTPNRDSGRII